jgi:hypothetical protein
MKEKKMTEGMKLKIANETRRICVCKENGILALSFIGKNAKRKFYFMFKYEYRVKKDEPKMQCIADLLIKHEEELNDICKLKGREYRDFFSLVDAFDFREIFNQDVCNGFLLSFGDLL